MDFAEASLLLPELQNMQDFCSTQQSQLHSTATKLPLVFGTFCKTCCNFVGCNSTLRHQNSNPHACWFFAGLCNCFCGNNPPPPPPPRLNFAAAKVKLLLQCKLGPFQTNKNACTITHFQQILSLFKTEAMM